MMLNPAAVSVFCASSAQVAPEIFAEGRSLARMLAEAGLEMVYGGTTCGLMGAISEAFKDAGGRLIGVVPQFMIEKGIKSPHLDEVVAVPDMAARKCCMADRSGAFVVFPGGIGTFDEFFDILAQKQLALHHKPIILCNVLGYFDHLLQMMRHGVTMKTLKDEHLGLFSVAAGAAEVMQILKSPHDSTYAGKWA